MLFLACLLLKLVRVLKKNSIQIVFCLLWLLMAGAGIAFELNYQNRSGLAGVTPEQWPSGIPLALDARRATLLMFVHPQCPCTQASVEELNRLLTQCGGQIATHILFFKPGKFSEDWLRSDLWRKAGAIPGVTVQDDLDGNLAHKFGAETSGYALLYDTHGKLLFKGGITASRGHAGDNAGAAAIVAFAAGENPGVNQTSVYGCSLLNTTCSRDPITR